MNAIVLAAGVGSRLQPLTLSVPKPLTIVDNDPIVERQIKCLQTAGIKEIHVVVGYQAEKFEYLRRQYNVNLVYNPYYSEFNNIYSLFLCREFLENTWILEGDVFIRKNFLPPAIQGSTYFSVFRPDITSEWVLEFSANHKLTRILTSKDSPGLLYGNGTYTMSGISFWDQYATQKIKHHLYIFSQNIRGAEKQAQGSQYWDQIIIDNLNEFEIFVEKVETGDCFEVDTEKDLDTLRSIL